MGALVGLHNMVFRGLQMALEGWALGLLARLWFAATLLFFFWNGAMAKLGDDGLVDLSRAAAQMIGAPFFDEPYYGDASLLGADFVAMAYAGTIAEFVLPALIVAGLFTRVASVGMILFIAVMTYVDITAHGIAFETELLFNGKPETVTPPFANAVLMEGRLAWMFPLIYLVVRGAGAISLDALFRNTMR